MSAASKPNVILIVSEDHGPHLGCYGDANARTPFLDELAAAGVRFDNHYTTTAICSPGRASILTGLHPHQNGQLNLATHRYAMYRPFANLATMFKDAGYRTARLGKLHVLPEEAIPFDMVWNDHDFLSFHHRDVDKPAQVAGEFVGEHDADQPRFIYACFSDAHLPMHHQSFGEPKQPLSGDDVTLPDFCPIDSPHMRDRLAGYYNCLARLDTCVKKLVEAVRSSTSRETVILFTTDHGQQFIRGKVTCYEGGLRVSLIAHAPGRISQGVVRKELTSHVDLLPTLAQMFDLPLPAQRLGRSLLPLLNNEQVQWHEHVIGQWNGSPGMFYPQRSIRDERYKLIVNYPAMNEGHQKLTEEVNTQPGNPGAAAYLGGGLWETSLDEADREALTPTLREALERSAAPPAYELYDLQEDPTELVNLAGRAEVASQERALRHALVDWQHRYDDRVAQPGVFEAMARLHEQMRQKHYSAMNRIPQDRDKMHWQYADLIDPGVPQA